MNGTTANRTSVQEENVVRNRLPIPNDHLTLNGA